MRIWFLKTKQNTTTTKTYSFSIFLLWSHKNFLYSNFQSLGNRAASLEKTVAICSKYKIAYFPLATLQGFRWRERILFSREIGRDQALNLAYCQNLAEGGRDILKIIYLPHQFGNWLKAFCICNSFSTLQPFVGVHPSSGSPHWLI